MNNTTISLCFCRNRNTLRSPILASSAGDLATTDHFKDEENTIVTIVFGILAFKPYVLETNSNTFSCFWSRHTVLLIMQMSYMYKALKKSRLLGKTPARSAELNLVHYGSLLICNTEKECHNMFLEGRKRQLVFQRICERIPKNWSWSRYSPPTCACYHGATSTPEYSDLRLLQAT